ncbi:MAG TPA: hypothetical protein PKU77_00735 [Ferruginibacter sp.]|nr:hypothetical protein [Ferruginibacter sp.]
MTQPMNFNISALTLVFKKSTEVIPLTKISYFYGQMGAGKSSIARLIYYCLGGDLDFSPALQSEFVSAEISLSINKFNIVIDRARESDQVHVKWSENDEELDLILPARKADGILIPNTEIEVLSDLLFHFAGIDPPKVRKSKTKEESALARLSFIDMLWYCYLDQDSFDSDFFHLGEDAHVFKRLKSRDVLRFILGFHQEKVAELESLLQELHIKKIQFSEASKSLQQALIDADVETEAEILIKVDSLKKDSDVIDQQLLVHRKNRSNIPHGTDKLREKGRLLSYEIESLENAIPEIEKIIDQDKRHKNEIMTLGIKVKRVASARAVLAGVTFDFCPRCAQKLPERESDLCGVCGQEEPVEGESNLNADVLEQDTKSRISELEESINLHSEQLRRIRRKAADLNLQKQKINDELSSQMAQYDSAYLSNALVLERQKAEIGQQILNFEKLIKLPQKVRELQKKASETQVEETQIRQDLEEARKGAESNLSNLVRLKELFLDCLLRSKLSGFTANSEVEISHKDFLPEVTRPDVGDVATTSFANLSSGGKKTLFKACYGLAIHRLAVEIGALLPTFLIIDSPMKNISERENIEQFQGFHDLIYDLASDELAQTQFILIDKEYLPPTDEQNLDFSSRHMAPESIEYPPLIPYYS